MMPTVSTPSATLPTYGPERRTLILSAFRGKPEPVSVSLVYRLGLLLLTVAMVLLPLAYLGLMGAVAWWTWNHGMTAHSVFGQLGSAKVEAYTYFGPLLIGILTVVFMVKPLFIRFPGPPEPLSLNRRDEPILFGFVEQLCKNMGAPVPKRIDIDCRVNASASFRRGFHSLTDRGDLVLTIGLPLVAGLSLSQFAGVLAHEFGHFAQGAGMRLTYIIRSINGWFYRVVHERDQLDEDLQGAMGGGAFLFIVSGLAQLMIWLSRRVLWVLMHVGHGLSSFMLRQMEYDADRHGIRLTGKEVFESTFHELQGLSLSYEQSLEELQAFWRQGVLVDSLPGLVGSNRHQLSNDTVLALRQQIESEKTGLFDSHPATKDRIASGRREGSRPVFESRLGAAALFRDFNELSRRVSKDFYERSLGEKVDVECLIAMDDLEERRRKGQEAHEALSRVFQGVANSLRPLPLQLPPFDPQPIDTAALIQSWAADRDRLIQGAEAYQRSLEKYDELDTQRLNLFGARTALAADFPFEFEALGLRDGLPATVERAIAEVEASMADLEEELRPMEGMAHRRLHWAFLSLGHPSLAERTDLRSMGESAREVTAAHGNLLTCWTLFQGLRDTFNSYGYAYGHLQGHADHSGLIQQVATLADGLVAQLQHLRSILDQMPCPDDPDTTITIKRESAENGAGGEAADASTRTLGEALFSRTPDRMDLDDLYDLTGEVLRRRMGMTQRFLGRLALATEAMERELLTGAEGQGKTQAA